MAPNMYHWIPSQAFELACSESRTGRLPALIRLENSTSHFSVWPIRSVSQSTASVNARSGRMIPAIRALGSGLQLCGVELVDRRLGEREPLRLLGAELLPFVVDLLELRVLCGLLVVELGGGLVGAVHDVVGEAMQLHAGGL